MWLNRLGTTALKEKKDLYNTETEIGCLSFNNFYLPENLIYPHPSGVEVVQEY